MDRILAGKWLAMCRVCAKRMRVYERESERERDALTFNDAVCISTSEVIITNTMQVIAFDPHSTKSKKAKTKGSQIQTSLLNRQLRK